MAYSDALILKIQTEVSENNLTVNSKILIQQKNHIASADDQPTVTAMVFFKRYLFQIVSHGRPECFYNNTLEFLSAKPENGISRMSLVLTGVFPFQVRRCLDDFGCFLCIFVLFAFF